MCHGSLEPKHLMREMDARLGSFAAQHAATAPADSARPALAWVRDVLARIAAHLWLAAHSG